MTGHPPRWIVRGEPIATEPGSRPQNLVDLVHRSVVALPDKEAVRWRDRHESGWSRLTYRQLWDRVHAVSRGLAASGVHDGDRIVILSRSRPEWLIADLASLALGAVTCPIYPGDPPGRMALEVHAVRARLAFVETPQLLARLLEGIGEESGLRVVLFENGTRGTRDIPTLAELAAATEASTDDDRRWEEGWRSIGPGRLATIAHTLGEDGLPRGSMLTHGNVVHNLYAATQALGITADDVALSVLPMSHMLERGPGVYVPLGRGATVVFADRNLERWAANLAEVRPTLMVTVPPFFERIERRIRENLGHGPAWRRAVIAWAERLGRRSYAAQLEGRRDPPLLAAQRWVARRTVLAGLRRATGGRLRFFISGGAPLRRETGLLFHTLGVLILEGYGLTETAPLLSVNRPAAFRFGTVGPPVAATELRIDPASGGVHARGPQVMSGYLDRPDLNERLLDPDGWFHTGDRGRLDPAGRLRITGRIKNLIVLATGKKVAPAPIERALEASPYIQQAVLLGDRMEAAGALVLPDRILLAARLADLGQATGEEALSELLAAELERCLAPFAAFERPRRYALLPRRLTLEAGELRADGVPDRAAIASAFPGLVATLFDGHATASGATRFHRTPAATPAPASRAAPA